MKVSPAGILSLLVLLVGICACTAPTPTQPPPTATAVPTRTPSPTLTALPPSATPSPLPSQTPTPAPTRTPQPSATRRPPADSPTPAVFRRSLALEDPYLFGEDVLALQQRLLALGYDQLGEADGVFGPATLKSVKDFQSSQGLFVDGIVGPLTWSLIFDPSTRHQKSDLVNGYGQTDTLLCDYDLLWMSWMMNLAFTDPDSANPGLNAQLIDEDELMLLNGPWAGGGFVWTQEILGDFYAPDSGDFLVARDPASREVVKQWRILDLLFWEPTVMALAEVNGSLWLVDQQGLIYVVAPTDPPQVSAQYSIDDEIRHLRQIGDRVWAAGSRKLHILSAQDGTLVLEINQSYDSLDVIEGTPWGYSGQAGGLVRLDAETGNPLSVYEFDDAFPNGCFDGQDYWYIDFYDGMLKKVEVLP